MKKLSLTTQIAIALVTTVLAGIALQGCQSLAMPPVPWSWESIMLSLLFKFRIRSTFL